MITKEQWDTIRLAITADFEIETNEPLEQRYERAVAHLQALGLSLRSIVGDVKEATLLNQRSATFWRVWLCGPGIVARLQQVGFTLTPLPEDLVRLSWGDELHAALYAEATGASVPTVMLERWAERAWDVALLP